MLSATFHDRMSEANDPDFSVDVTRYMATFSTPEILYIIRRNSYTSQGGPDSSFPLWPASLLDVKLLRVIETRMAQLTPYSQGTQEISFKLH